MFAIVFVGLAWPSRAQTAEPPVVRRPIVARQSAHFVVHTDMSQAEADAALERMEQALRFAVRCWGREVGEPITCYLVSDLENWPRSSLPHPLARIFVGRVGGATLGRPHRSATAVDSQVTIYASTAPGVVEHEVMHAYCSVIFGEGGPEWFREGMAEMASYHEDSTQGVQCPPERLLELRNAQPPTISDIRKAGRSTKRLSDSLSTMMTRRPPGEHHVELAAWTDLDARSLVQARREYLWSWALCHMLYHNPNYADRFKAIADCYLSGRQIPFDQVYASMHREMMFEYRLFLQEAQVGYRVDLCKWDWNHTFSSLDSATNLQGKCHAARGWQATGLTVVQGTSYAYRARGVWSGSPQATPQDADGGDDGNGRLVAVVMNDFRLGEPFRLGVSGVFVAPVNGRLYFRYRDAWNSLDDNGGTLQVEFTRLGDDPPVASRL